MKKFPRRHFLHLATGAIALPAVSRIARAEDSPPQPQSKPKDKTLAERLAAYADGLRYEDLDAETLGRTDPGNQR